MTNLLKLAKDKYPKGSLFFSASKLVKSPIRVTAVKMSEVYKNTIINVENGGIIYDGETKTWAKKVVNK